MSNPRAKAERSKAKDFRQMPVNDIVRPRRSKKEKPIYVECKLIKPWSWYGKDWGYFGKYRTIEEAEKAIANEKRKHPDLYKLRIRDKA